MDLGPDYMRLVRTLTGKTQTGTIKFTWDRSESMKQLHETGTRLQIGMRWFFRSASCKQKQAFVWRLIWSQTGLKSVCVYMVPRSDFRPVRVICVGSATRMSETGMRWFFRPASCKQKQAFVWRPIWSQTGLSSYWSHVIRALIPFVTVNKHTLCMYCIVWPLVLRLAAFQDLLSP